MPPLENVITGAVVLIGSRRSCDAAEVTAGHAAFANKGIPITSAATRADGISDGAIVLFRGVEVGKVTHLRARRITLPS